MRIRKIRTIADECLGHRIVEGVYTHFEIPDEFRCEARKTIVLQKNEPMVAAALHENHFAGRPDIDPKIAGCIYMANKVIHTACKNWGRRGGFRNGTELIRRVAALSSAVAKQPAIVPYRFMSAKDDIIRLVPN